MEVIIAVLGGLSFASMIYLGVHFRLLRNRELKLLDWFLLSMATFNGIGFGFVLWATHEGRNLATNLTQFILNYDNSLVIAYILLSTAFMLCVVFGWYLTIAFCYKFKQKKKVSSVYKEQYFLRKSIFVAWLMLIIAVGTYWLYTKVYGGFIAYLDYANLIRSGVFNIQNPYSFFQRFGGFSFFSSFIFFALLIDKENKKMLSKKSLYIGLFLSLCFSFYVLYSWVGRVSIVVYVSTFFLGYILYSYKSVFSLMRKILFFSISALLSLVLTDAILGRTDNKLGIIEFFTGELSFPFTTFSAVSTLSQYRWFTDIVVAPLYLLPSRIWAVFLDIETASSFNTFLISGARKGDSDVLGEIPVDILSFSFMQGNVLGVILVGLMWGSMLYILQRLISKIRVKSIRSIISANIIINVSIMSVLYGDPQHIIVRNFPIIFGFIMMGICLKFSITNKKIIPDKH
ncbi:hypothetical protein [Bacillus mycoides]|uniref:hypothetical protein n=1 Tax=Bacillus mycoides TaxID=1405 RepID=UPI002111C1D4|nr:hypothetical protein [Bacillus mycoides]MCQ6526092.1 hypothetical protein [Bacillus mycoides]